MAGQCPGQDTRKLTVGLFRCPNCGYQVEIFSDEYKRRCPKCKEVVEKDAVPSCAAWCAAAKDCLGKERYEKFLEQSAREKEKEEAEEAEKAAQEERKANVS